MNKLIEKTKDLLIGKETPVTKDSVKMLAITGKVCTVEERTTEFINKINLAILEKAKFNKFRYLVELPKDLIPQSKTIQEDFKSRGFKINDLNEVFLISWYD